MSEITMEEARRALKRAGVHYADLQEVTRTTSGKVTYSFVANDMVLLEFLQKLDEQEYVTELFIGSKEGRVYFSMDRPTVEVTTSCLRELVDQVNRYTEPKQWSDMTRMAVEEAESALE